MIYDHCFIPAISGLGFNNTNVNWSQRLDDRNLVCTGEIPFDNYYIPINNEPHSYFTTASSKWLEQEVDKGQMGCPPICTFSYDNPPNAICLTSPTTITFDAPIPTAAGFSTTWSVSSNIQILTSTNNSVTVIGIISGSAGYINAEIINPCGANKTFSKTLFVGKSDPPVPSITLSPTPNCYKWEVSVSFPNPPIGVTYDWSTLVTPDCSTPACSMTGVNAGTYTKILTAGQKIMWGSSASNSCGTEYHDGEILELKVYSGSPCTAYLQYIGAPPKNTVYTGINAPNDDIIIFPNPSSEFWTISLMKDHITEFNYVLTDITGKTLKKGEYKGLNMNDIKIDNTALPIGTYLLNIHTSDRKYNFKLIKE